MKGRKLEFWEALKILQNGGTVVDIDNNPYIWRNFSVLDEHNFFDRGYYEHIEPPKPKNLLERFAERWEIELTYDSGHIYTNISKVIEIDELIAWLDWQPESRIKGMK